MTDRLQYGTTAKVFHWLIVALLMVQYPIGWLMPDIHRGMKPGDAMTYHISIGIVILALIVLRLAWRLTHPIAPESSLAPWQRVTSEAMHWLLYILVLATTISDRPMVKDWVRVWLPYRPGAASTPSRCPVKLTVVWAGQ